MSWFEKLMPSRIRTEGGNKKAVPEGLWAKCPSCNAVLYRAEMERNMEVCPKCGHHNRIDARRRLDLFLDPDGREEIAAELESGDPLKFKDSKKYKERLSAAQKKTGEKDALIVMRGQLKGSDVVAAAFEFEFMGGSMGSVVGQRFVEGVNTAIERRCPMVSFSASGGARMQEGILSLMQMPRTTVAVEMVRDAGLPYIVVLTHPTTGGVTASYAMLGDVHIAEPNALICFAGPRVIEQTIREKLPEGFQRAEYLLDHGMLDRVTHRRDMKDELVTITRMLLNLPPAVKGELPAPQEVSEDAPATEAEPAQS